MKIEIQYHYSVPTGANAQTFTQSAVERAERFFGAEGVDDITVVIAAIGSGANEQLRAECVAVRSEWSTSGGTG